MDLEFSGEQDMLREMVRGPAGPAQPARRRSGSWRTTRRATTRRSGPSSQALDLVGLLLPEEAGGSGQSMLEGVVLYEELGQSLAPTPHFVSAVLTGGVLAAAGGHDELLGADRLGREDRHGRLARARRRLPPARRAGPVADGDRARPA